MRFGVIGTNFISDRFCEAASRSDSAEVYAIYSRKADTGHAFCQRNGGGIKVYTSYDEMLADTLIDAVYVASPTMCHKEHAIAALKAGKAVLCEKMICTSLDEFIEMEAAAKSTRGTLIEAMRTDFDPYASYLGEALSKIGKLRRAHFTYCQYSSRYDAFLKGDVKNAFDPKMKNSALADIGIYPLHLAISLFGAPLDVTSKSLFLHNGFEGAGEILMTYEGMLATVSYSKITEGTTPSVIEGEEGSVTIDSINAPTRITLNRRGEEPYTYPHHNEKNNMIFEIEGFIRAVGDPEYRDRLLSTTRTVMETVEKIRPY